MADLHINTEESPTQTPLLIPIQNHNHNHQVPQQEQNEETQLDQTLKRLETFLALLGFNQSSWLSIALSWVAFLLIGVVLPVVVLEQSKCSGCELYQIKKFKLDIVASQACLAAVSLLCLSHNLRKYGIRRFLFVDRFNASQFLTLLQTTGYSGTITLINGGDFAVSTIVQVVGIILCLHAATKISHRAQAITSLASRWHALVTCSSADSSQHRVSNNVGNMEPENFLNYIDINYSESDLESLDYVAIPTNSQLASYMSSYHKREAFGMKFTYLVSILHLIPVSVDFVIISQRSRNHA
ncbi:hypothetical protein SO802_012071 [Lithocarpus litseifolius]|uniref:Uncharacterized protein n=1 Tax=Lithocarpus litseifolius TaxID=425828 RepID=A0AAW2D5T3_9ROSI